MSPDLFLESKISPKKYMLAKSIKSLSTTDQQEHFQQDGGYNNNNIFKEPLSVLLCQQDPNPGPRYKDQILVKHSIVGKPDWLKRGGIQNQSIFKQNARKMVDDQSTIKKATKRTLILRRNTKQQSTNSSIPTQSNGKVYNRKEIIDQFEAIRNRIQRNQDREKEELMKKSFEERQKYLRDSKVLEKHDDMEKQWNYFIKNSSQILNRDVSESQLMDCEEYRRMMEYRKSHEKAREMHLNRERKFWELSDTKDLPILVCDKRNRDIRGKLLEEPIMDNLEMIRKPSYSWQHAFKSFTSNDVMKERLSQYEEIIEGIDKIKVDPEQLYVSGMNQLDWEMKIIQNENNGVFYKKLDQNLEEEDDQI